MRLTGAPLPAPTSNTLVDALARAARSSEGVTLVDASEHEQFYAWKELAARAAGVAGALARQGIREGDRVALVLATGIDFLDAFFGAVIAGAVPVPLYPPMRLGRLEEYHASTARMLRASGARIVLTDAKIRLLLGRAIAEARPDRGLVTVEALRSSGAEPLAPVQVRPEALALIQFSSGSTVDPKPVGLTHANLVTQLAALAALMPAEPGDVQRGVSWLPLYHDMGLIGCLLSGVYMPGALTLIPPEVFLARPALWLRAISRHRATISPAPNFAYALCLRRVAERDLEGVDLSSWRFALNGAEPVSAAVMHRFTERFSPQGFSSRAFLPVYGLSEASLAVTFSPSGRTPRTLEVDANTLALEGRAVPGTRPLVSVGVPVPGAEVEIRSEEGARLGPHALGRIFVRGPFVMRAYFGAAGPSAAEDGWLDTGDLGFISDGELYIAGRVKDLVIIRGANHVPQEFEECFELLEGVRPGTAMALGFVPDGAESEELLLLAEHVGALEASLESRIRTAVLERTGIRAHTVRLVAPGTLPRTSSGKLRRAEALRRFLADELTAPAPVNTARLAVEMARSAWALVRTPKVP